MGGFSFWHILLLALVVMLLFGGKRFSAMMGDVAAGLKNFKAGMSNDEEEKQDRRGNQRHFGMPDPLYDVPPHARRAEPINAPPPLDPRG